MTFTPSTSMETLQCTLLLGRTASNASRQSNTALHSNLKKYTIKYCGPTVNVKPDEGSFPRSSLGRSVFDTFIIGFSSLSVTHDK